MVGELAEGAAQAFALGTRDDLGDIDLENRPGDARGEDGIPLCDDDGRFFLDTVAPILSEGDVLGSVVFTSPEDELGGGEVEYKLAQSIAAFLGKHMES